jgi:hypothetical protein
MFSMKPRALRSLSHSTATQKSWAIQQQIAGALPLIVDPDRPRFLDDMATAAGAENETLKLPPSTRGRLRSEARSVHGKCDTLAWKCDTLALSETVSSAQDHTVTAGRTDAGDSASKVRGNDPCTA